MKILTSDGKTFDAGSQNISVVGDRGDDHETIILKDLGAHAIGCKLRVDLCVVTMGTGNHVRGKPDTNVFRLDPLLVTERPLTVYRDATYSAKTQAELRSLLAWLESERFPPWHVALRDVVQRWDANEATEGAPNRLRPRLKWRT